MEEITIDKVFDNVFNSGRNLSPIEGQSKLKKVLFPKITIIEEGDKYFETIWGMIDNAKDHIAVIMYHFDDTNVANITLQKLTDAAKRGVEVNLLHDVLVSSLDKKLETEFRSAGGREYKLGELYRIDRIWTREYFKRDHEKFFLVDNSFTLGSANISDDYASKRHGDSFFFDLNLKAENACLEKVRSFVWRVADFHGVRLDDEMTNQQYMESKNELFPSSDWCPKDYDVLESYQPDRLEIQEHLIEKIQNAKSKIRVISPYYYPIKIMDTELINAAKRGVDVEIVTARKRDIPCYRNMRNFMLMRKLIENGVKVYQVKEKYLHMKGFSFDDESMNFGSFNLDKWSWDNNNELNFKCENEILIHEFNHIYEKVKNECLKVEKPSPMDFFTRAKIIFWTVFLTGVNFTMNYRRMIRTDARNEGGEKFFKEKILGEGGKKLKDIEIPEDIVIYKRIFYSWDEVIGED